VRRGLWILVAMGMGGLLATALLGRYYLGTASGVDETVDLQATLRTAHGSLFEEEPPLRVFRVPGGRSEGRPAWRWKVEGTLRAETDPAAPYAAHAFDRIVSRCLGTRVAGRPLDGVILRFRRKGGPDLEREFDAAGALLPPAPPPPAAAPAPPARPGAPK